MDACHNAGIEKSSIPALRTRVQVISHTLPVTTRRKQKDVNQPLQDSKHSWLCGSFDHFCFYHTEVFIVSDSLATAIVGKLVLSKISIVGTPSRLFLTKVVQIVELTLYFSFVDTT